MSYVLATSQVGYLTNKEKEDFLYSDEDGDDYNFKYISGNQFKYIIKDVRRQRCKEEEERAWHEFVKRQELNDARYGKEDRELRRLEEDTIPEYKIRSHIESNEMKRNRLIHPVNVKEYREENSAKRITKTESSDTITIDVERSIVEENLSPHKKSVRSKRSCDLRRTSSEYMIVQSKHLKQNCPCEFDYNSTPDLSIQYESDKEDNICVHPDPMAAHKILVMQKRISELLDEISFNLDRIPLPDGDMDLKRRQQRVVEFCIRLSRNYLYDLTRCIGDIQKHVRAVSPSAKIKSGPRGIAFHMQIIEQKLIAAHQLLLHALTAYCKHIPCSIPQGHSKKIKELLKVVTDLKDICDHIQLTTNYFGSGDTCALPLEKETQAKCNIILSKLKLSSGTESQLDDHNIVSNTAMSVNIPQTKKHCKRKNLETHLRMYNMETRAYKRNFKRKLSTHQHTQNKKYNACSNKSIYSGHLFLPQQPHSSPVTNASAKEIIKDSDTKYKTCLKEDNIKTIMGTVSIDSDNDLSLEIQQPKHSNGLILPKKSKATKDFSDKLHNIKCSRCKEKHNKRSNLLNLCNDPTNKKNDPTISDEILLEFLKKCGSFAGSINKDITNIDCISCIPPKNSITKSSTKEVVKSKKNMHLICLSSLDKTSNQHISCDALGHMDYHKRVHKDKKTKDIIQKNGMTQLLLSKGTETKLLQYRTDYYNLSKRSPMYSNNTQNKPWDIVAWISDKLVDELINEIAKELEMQDIIQKMYQLEFQEY
ncbi:hypothetical protein KPH14_012001 [Odynerus spinipes]|uniref:Uncharacterized protein n=1 Tax=Odynerus spinipes TaxID=1348599 RepID=A0AAD9RE56_9HYME|nr:hypothetical protein KPH14_012001 [Odynerus spinipes]